MSPKRDRQDADRAGIGKVAKTVCRILYPVGIASFLLSTFVL